jgi:hypothetical protein
VQFAVSAHKVQSILFTTDAHDIDLVFLCRRGDPYAHIWQAKMGSTAVIRCRQIEVADGPEGLAFVRDGSGPRRAAPSPAGVERPLSSPP